METPSKSKIKPINAIIFFVILLTLGLWLPSQFSFTATKSLDHRLFYIASFSPGADIIKQNNHVMFKKYHPLIAKMVDQTDTDIIIKKVACASGSNLRVDGLNYYCDWVLVGTALEKTPSGVKVDNFKFDGTIPAGKIFVMGTSFDSVDSRYFGFIEERDVLAIAYPIF